MVRIDNQDAACLCPAQLPNVLFRGFKGVPGKKIGDGTQMILKIVRRLPLLPVRLVQRKNTGSLLFHLLRQDMILLCDLGISFQERDDINDCRIGNAEKEAEQRHRLRKLPLVSAKQEHRHQHQKTCQREDAGKQHPLRAQRMEPLKRTEFSPPSPARCTYPFSIPARPD